MTRTSNYNSKQKNTFLQALKEKSNILGELEVREFKSYFNHQFSHIPQDEDISKLWFTVDRSSTENTTIDRHGAEYRIHLDAVSNESMSIETNEHGHYSPGSVSLPGIGMRVVDDLSGEQEVRGGYFCDTDGMGIGEDSDGLFLFKRDGGAETKIRQENWNRDVLDGSENNNNPSGLELNDLQDGHIVRFPFLCYNYGEANVFIGVKDSKNVDFVNIHTFTERGDELFERINLPIQLNIQNNGTAETLDAYLAACHFERLSQESDSRQNGVVRWQQSVGDTSLTPLISWRLRDGWNGVNSRPQSWNIVSDTDLKIELQLDPALSTTSFSLPDNTSSNECAVEFDTSATSFDSLGERRWVGFVKGGGGSVKFSSISANVNFELPVDQVVTLAAISRSGTATVDSSVKVSSEF